MKNKAQQEMVGFVLIVVIVIVGLMVFLIMSLRNPPEEQNSLEVENMLNTILRYTTDCAISYEPKYSNFKDLFKSCYESKQCSNLEKSACDYLNESLKDVIKDILESDQEISKYQLDFFERADGVNKGIFRISEGNCTGKVIGAQERFVSKSNTLIVEMRLCKI